jgi:hypothetical protein
MVFSSLQARRVTDQDHGTSPDDLIDTHDIIRIFRLAQKRCVSRIAYPEMLYWTGDATGDERCYGGERKGCPYHVRRE